jgi:hypothetical protein
MRKIVLNIFVVVVVLQSTIFAQEEDLMTKTFTAYMYGMLNETARENAVKTTLAERPEIANGNLNDVPIFQWALDHLGYDEGQSRKARKLAELLIQNGADVDGKDKYGKPFLLHYAMFARLAQMEFLVTHGADVNAKDVEDGRTALHWVALLNEVNQEERLIKKTLKAADLLLNADAEVDTRDIRGNTPLHSAAFLGNLQMVKLLISGGADINARNDECYSVLGLVLLRNDERWANADEKKALLPVIAYLQDLGAQDVSPYSPDGQYIGCGTEIPEEEAELNLNEWFESPAGAESNEKSLNAPPDPSAVPEPGTLILMGTGVFGLLASMWRRNRKKK